MLLRALVCIDNGAFSAIVRYVGLTPFASPLRRPQRLHSCKFVEVPILRVRHRMSQGCRASRTSPLCPGCSLAQASGFWRRGLGGSREEGGVPVGPCHQADLGMNLLPLVQREQLPHDEGLLFNPRTWTGGWGRVMTHV